MFRERRSEAAEEIAALDVLAQPSRQALDRARAVA